LAELARLVLATTTSPVLDRINRALALLMAGVPASDA
jgi:hypothetical protein